MTAPDLDFDFDQEPNSIKWRCDTCGHTSATKPHPTNREAFYAKVAQGKAPNCPKCGSEACFLPVGF